MNTLVLHPGLASVFPERKIYQERCSPPTLQYPFFRSIPKAPMCGYNIKVLIVLQFHMHSVMVLGQCTLGPWSLPWRELHIQGQSLMSAPLASYCPSCTTVGKSKHPKEMRKIEDSREEGEVWCEDQSPPGVGGLGGDSMCQLLGSSSGTTVSSTTNTKGLPWCLLMSPPQESSCAQENCGERQSHNKRNTWARQCEWGGLRHYWVSSTRLRNLMWFKPQNNPKKYVYCPHFIYEETVEFGHAM